MQGKTVSAKAPAVTSFFNLNSLQKFDDDIPSPSVQNTAAASKPAIDTPVLQKSEESISSRFSTIERANETNDNTMPDRNILAILYEEISKDPREIGRASCRERVFRRV